MLSATTSNYQNLHQLTFAPSSNAIAPLFAMPSVATLAFPCAVANRPEKRRTMRIVAECPQRVKRVTDDPPPIHGNRVKSSTEGPSRIVDGRTESAC
jgi:hypothetical protein